MESIYQPMVEKQAEAMICLQFIYQKIVKIFCINGVWLSIVKLHDEVALAGRLGNGDELQIFIVKLSPRMLRPKCYSSAHTDNILHGGRRIGFKYDVGIKSCYGTIPAAYSSEQTGVG